MQLSLNFIVKLREKISQFYREIYALFEKVV